MVSHDVHMMLCVSSDQVLSPPQGDQGLRGRVGIPGVTGDMGSKGEKGDMGMKGEKGIHGIRGRIGEENRKTVHLVTAEFLSVCMLATFFGKRLKTEKREAELLLVCEEIRGQQECP